jgi:hypothetical protein
MELVARAWLRLRVGNMSYPIKYPTPQSANIQIFQAPRTTNTTPINHQTNASWTKPQGASFVYFCLIGSGGGGGGYDAVDAGGGGGSGAVTNFMCPAFLIPDQLRIQIGVGGNSGNNSVNTFVTYQQKATTAYTLLTAGSGGGGATGGVGGAIMSANGFTAMGFFQTIVGQNGVSGAQSASSTTFLSGGGISAGTSNYGYTSPLNNTGYFQTQPIIVGTGGAGSGDGGIGCGGGVNSSGGNGMVVIITW